ncbi:MAG: peptidoglycan DL-endopeptidase CwlO [Cryptosporangiaceae bacterium]|nr:peptidoglycan DL-endopeptidase CwlO [Cryptosporangiaceae bacterium]
MGLRKSTDHGNTDVVTDGQLTRLARAGLPVPVRRVPIRVALAAVAAGALLVPAAPAFAAPAPGIGQAPSTGSRPVPSGSLPLPSAGSAASAPVPGQLPSGILGPSSPAGGSLPLTLPVANTATSPLLAQLAQQDAAAEAMSERVNDARVELATRTAAHDALAAQLSEARSAVEAAGREAATWARSAYIQQATRPDALELEPTQLGDPALLGLLPPAEMGGTPLDRLAVAQQSFEDVQSVESAAWQTVAAARAQLQSLQTQLTALGAESTRLRAQNAASIATAQSQQDAANAQLSAQYLKDAAGQANPKALAAVAWALQQLGKPYQWGAEGPAMFDCSGLVQAAYAHAGVSLPRTARPQYRATKEVPINALHPGDLLFFATNRSDWNTIHHVAIYLGQGKMLHAPQNNEVVKISPIWWAEFYRATRVVDAPNTPAPQPQPAPASSPTPAPSPKPDPRPDPKPTHTPSPKPTGGPSPAPSSPAPCPSPDPSPSASPSPSPTPSAAGSPEPPPANGSPSPSSPGSPTPSVSGSPAGASGTAYQHAAAVKPTASASCK